MFLLLFIMILKYVRYINIKSKIFLKLTSFCTTLLDPLEAKQTSHCHITHQKSKKSTQNTVQYHFGILMSPNKLFYHHGYVKQFKIFILPFNLIRNKHTFSNKHGLKLINFNFKDDVCDDGNKTKNNAFMCLILNARCIN